MSSGLYLQSSCLRWSISIPDPIPSARWPSSWFVSLFSSCPAALCNIPPHQSLSQLLKHCCQFPSLLDVPALPLQSDPVSRRSLFFLICLCSVSFTEPNWCSVVPESSWESEQWAQCCLSSGGDLSRTLVSCLIIKLSFFLTGYFPLLCLGCTVKSSNDLILVKLMFACLGQTDYS